MLQPTFLGRYLAHRFIDTNLVEDSFNTNLERTEYSQIFTQRSKTLLFSIIFALNS